MAVQTSCLPGPLRLTAARRLRDDTSMLRRLPPPASVEVDSTTLRVPPLSEAEEAALPTGAGQHRTDSTTRRWQEQMAQRPLKLLVLLLLFTLLNSLPFHRLFRLL
ncbi:unnamed protein product [Hydatigera taeniaeformis]|uniref:Uncharacterized protein n=1 Tax=Hydatigena taeniaeformis TaxID=6205 RepID=A0A0R3WIQ0_HYDTA|nr:unnamed protein product [Hydatigera taeniaeformis]